MNLRELRYKISSRENLSGNLSKITSAGDKTNRVLGAQNTKLQSLKSNFRGAASEIPGFSRVMAVAANPITLATGAIGLLALGLNKAKNEAAAFKTEFRDLQNLNLGKNAFGMALMESNVLGTASRNGFDALRTSQAFYDVQSIANIQGYQASQLVSKAGMFSKVMKSDFNKTIAGSAQVMDIYGISVNKADDYLNSMFKTVMVGKTTFDEMSKVQVEYANAAASAGQDYNNANKIFAAFSKTQKSVDIAANMTKTAFQDLTKKSTLDGLKRIGVSVFDAKNQMLGVDKILQNLIPKLQGMNDLQFAKLKEEIGGGEGLRGLLDMAKSSGDKLLASFQQFDSSDMDFNKALKIARNDVNFINDQITNKLKVSWITLGETVLPMWIGIKQTILSTVDELNEKLYSLQRSYYRFTDPAKYRQLGQIRAEQKMEQGYELARGKMRDQVGRVLGKDGWNEENKEKLKSALNAMTMQIYFLDPNDDWADRKNKQTGRQKFADTVFKALASDDQNALAALYADEIANPGGAGGGTGSLGGSGLGSKVNAIGAGGPKTINITQNIDIDINSTGIEGTATDLSDAVEEGLVRVLQGVEEAHG